MTKIYLMVVVAAAAVVVVVVAAAAAVAIVIKTALWRNQLDARLQLLGFRFPDSVTPLWVSSWAKRDLGRFFSRLRPQLEK